MGVKMKLELVEVPTGVRVDGTSVKVGRSRARVGTGSKISRGMLEVGRGWTTIGVAPVTGICGSCCWGSIASANMESRLVRPHSSKFSA